VSQASTKTAIRLVPPQLNDLPLFAEGLLWSKVALQELKE
jgi:hypothetical protein